MLDKNNKNNLFKNNSFKDEQQMTILNLILILNLIIS